jgi:hypothetical protein
MTRIRPGRGRERGISLIGLLFWAILIAFTAMVAIKTFPSINEYLTIQRAINRIVSNGGGTVPEIRTAFDKQKDIEYSIVSISGKDLQVTKENDRVIVGFAYDKEVPLYGPVSLLIHYEGRTK